MDIENFEAQWKQRKSIYIQDNALTFDYFKLYEIIPKLESFDYLSLDIEGMGSRFNALARIICSGFKFKVMTIEHDSYRGFEKWETIPQRNLLKAFGYTLFRADVDSEGMIFEDWWICQR